MMVLRSAIFSAFWIRPIRLAGWILGLLILTLPMIALSSVWASAQDDIGLPIHPQAIPSTIIRQSGEGEGTRWIRVQFTINAPYKQVVKYYREQVGRDVQVSQIDSGTLLNTLILNSRNPADQFNVNISSESGKKVTKVELSRNFVRR